ncbi:MAG TPA: xanthine permease [Porphyromonadaceae bacterium]|jgi:xanthine/uracil permease|uniref:uracil-xanthine permease family protein n=1 Tax=Limibacterium fermenti TaxID=3229863 RepID=UPI000E858A69|nr:xanthine permease [Porphyromonadaceae bacterium]
MKYRLEDKPEPKAFVLFGLQWVSVILPSLVILSALTSKLTSEDSGIQMAYLCKVFVLTGAGLIAQILWGHRLPVLIGPATVLLIGIVSSSGASQEAVYTSIVLGGALLVLLSYLKLFDRVQKLFTRRVIVVILLLVSFTIMPLVVSLSLGSDGRPFGNFLYTLSLCAAIVVLNQILRGIWRSGAVLIAFIGGSLIYPLFFGGQAANEAGEGAFDLSVLMNHLFITPEFDFSVFLAFLFCFMALLVNEAGSIRSVGTLIDAPDLEHRTRRGVRMTGFFNMLAGVSGVIGAVDYSFSPGVIASSRCASRYPLILTGALLMVCPFVPGVIGWLTAIPSAVMGAVLLYVMSSQVSAGLQMLFKGETQLSFNDGLVIGLPLMLAVLIAFAPESFSESIPSLIRPIVGNGFVMGCLAVIALEHLLPRGD